MFLVCSFLGRVTIDLMTVTSFIGQVSHRCLLVNIFLSSVQENFDVFVLVSCWNHDVNPHSSEILVRGLPNLMISITFLIIRTFISPQHHRQYHRHLLLHQHFNLYHQHDYYHHLRLHLHLLHYLHLHQYYFYQFFLFYQPRDDQ